MTQRIPNEEILKDLKRVERLLDKDPTQEEYDEYGNHSTSLIHNRFGSFTESKRNAGIDIKHRSGVRITKKQCIEDLKEVSKHLGRAPTEGEYNEIGEYHAQVFRNKFGSFIGMRSKLNLDSTDSHQSVRTKEQCINELRRVSKLIEGEMGMKEFNEHSNISTGTIRNKLGNWNTAKRKAGIIVKDGSHKADIPKKKVLLDIKGLYIHLGHVPTGPEQREHGKYSDQPAKNKFGSYSNAREAAGIPKYKDITRENHSQWKGGERKEVSYSHPLFFENKEKTFERDNYQCRHPGCEITNKKHVEKYGKVLHSHHLTREHYPEDPEKHHKDTNLITLCAKHHPLWDSKGNLLYPGPACLLF